MEGVCVGYERGLKVIVEGLRRIVRDLEEAVDRTPHTVSSRPLIEGSLRLALGVYSVALNLEECSESV